ncbi:MAG: EAL domain-containing protein, partial [Ruminococcus sp.]|nr:EAL domain-containing protein [Ruminococcus sp.]
MKRYDEKHFYELYERLAFATSNVNQKPDVPLIESLLNEIAAMFRLSKGVTRFFRSPAEEKANGGETMISYDTGKEGIPVHTVRFTTRFMSITTMTVFMTEDEIPLDDDELRKVDLIMRTVLVYISRNRLQDIAEKLAFFDDAGYRNIRSFFNYILWKGQPGSLCGMIAMNYNLRHFSIINDEYGHDTGDIIMHRHYDEVESIIGDNGFLARLGGDNFVCVFSKSILPKMLAYLSEAYIKYDDEGDAVLITASAGVFDIPDDFEVRNPNDIMDKIIGTCRIAQNGGHERIVFYDESFIAGRDKVMRVQQKFPNALRNKEFKVFYQPKVNTFTGEICGAEALCRWFRKGKIVPPIDFIPALEETNDICKLDFYMLDLVCSHIRKWLDEGRKVVRISVNLSRKHIMNVQLLQNIIDIIDSHNVPHEYIEIELTETTTDIEFRDLKRVVSGLQEQNIFTSVDDFGMGYSSLNLIRVIPWNVLKVDRSFLPVEGEESDSVRSVMFKYVVAMAKELGLECIVEGVEFPVQLEILRNNKCELAQGFLFDRPLPLDEFEKRLDMKNYPM